MHFCLDFDMADLDAELTLAILGLQYAQDLSQGRTYTRMYISELRQWWYRWSRAYNLLLCPHISSRPLEWPATEGNLRAGSWTDTPGDCFRDIPHPPCIGNSVHDID